MTTIQLQQQWETGSLQVLDEVFEERKRQVARYGHNSELEDGTGPFETWLGLELDPGEALTSTDLELAFRADYEAHEAQTGKPTWMHLVREEVAEAFAETDPDRLEAELIQVAALCVSWVEKIRAR
jgi:hypothetical protein